MRKPFAKAVQAGAYSLWTVELPDGRVVWAGIGGMEHSRIYAEKSAERLNEAVEAWEQQVRMEHAHLAGNVGPILDALLASGGNATEMIERLAVALGFMYPSKALDKATDEELRAECRKRGLRLGNDYTIAPRVPADDHPDALVQQYADALGIPPELVPLPPETATSVLMRQREQQEREQRVANAAAQLLVEQLRHWMRQPEMHHNIAQIALDDRLRETARYITQIPRMLVQHGFARFALRNPKPPTFARVGGTAPTAQKTELLDVTVDGVMQVGWDDE